MHDHSHLEPGTPEYEEHLRSEIEHYAEVFSTKEAKETLFQPVPPSWNEVERRAAELIRRTTNNDMAGHVISRLEARPGTRMLSLGCGPGGVEIVLAQKARGASMLCLDVNAILLEQGRTRAAELGLDMTFATADLNRLDLPSRGFDLVFAHAALHHVLELERLFEQVRGCLRDGGQFVIVDVVTANGYRMWPETREVVAPLFRTLPSRFRVNHTAYGESKVDEEIWEADTSASGMECIRSQDILPLLHRFFNAVHYVPYFSISRRFLDTMYGPNYDLAQPLDRAALEWIWALDRHYLETGRLRPETFFGIYEKK
jgi:ubiquinone/menaquinone biosynthesis C-methylase UbiE